MWISSRPVAQEQVTLGRNVLVSAGLAVLFGLLPELARARAGGVLDPHPAWVAVLLLAARNGTNGCLLGLVAAALAVGVGAGITGFGPVRVWSSFESPHNLAAFAACLAVSWIVAWHLRTQSDLAARLHAVSRRAAEAEARLDELHELVARLRSRVDRTWTSLAFLRDVAERISGTDPIAAAEATADLALARTGGSAAAVHMVRGHGQRLLATRDARGPGALAPLDLRDAELSVPIRCGADRVGVIVIWGIPRGGIDEATAHDLGVIASWCLPALASADREPQRAADGAWSAP